MILKDTWSVCDRNNGCTAYGDGGVHVRLWTEDRDLQGSDQVPIPDPGVILELMGFVGEPDQANKAVLFTVPTEVFDLIMEHTRAPD